MPTQAHLCPLGWQSTARCGHTKNSMRSRFGLTSLFVVAASGSCGDASSTSTNVGALSRAKGDAGAEQDGASDGESALLTTHPPILDAGSATPIGDPTLPRTLYLENRCTQTLWSFAIPPSTFPNGAPLKMAPGQVYAVGWSNGFSGRIWGRTECTGSGENLSCAQRHFDTLAELTLTAGLASDWYDISLVDGFTLPLAIIQLDAPWTSTSVYVPGGLLGADSLCGSPVCAANLNENCPAAWQEKDSHGNVIGCENGMSGPSAGTQYFKNGCPTSYSWSSDDPQSLFRCPSAGQNAGVGSKDYEIIYCPTQGATPGFP
jgi:hypothetical protein